MGRSQRWNSDGAETCASLSLAGLRRHDTSPVLCTGFGSSGVRHFTESRQHLKEEY